MSRQYVTVDAVPDWKTMYPPERVGEYLNWLRKDWNPGEVIELKPGMMIVPPPEATLEGFLMWYADEATEVSKATKAPSEPPASQQASSGEKGSK